MHQKRFFFPIKVWLAAELLVFGLLAVTSVRAGETRSEGPATPLEQVVTVVEGLANEAGREGSSAPTWQNPLDLVQDTVKNVLTTALESVQSSSFVEAGMASWYGSAFQGRRTASGQRFDMNQLTAAHKTLPLGTVVQVRNPLNGKTVDVTINDRGPFIQGRVIDLSYRAAVALGIVQSGKQAVEVHRR